ncbi:hypothetical protein NicSoilC12_12640 [Arthrobacter sp. NicSoilC12]|nr:hypothetical protein NicSoilC12_12640 [Arthrobacter sp. NicSoilC12]
MAALKKTQLKKIQLKKVNALLAAVLMAAALGILAPAPAAADPYCGLVWGSLSKMDPAMSQAKVVNVRTGQHYCFDRLVVDLNGPVAGYSVRYVPAVVQDGSGLPVPLRGQAFIQLTVNAPAYDDAGNPTYNPPNKNELADVTGYQTFRQVAWAGSFEGYSTIGLGVRARLPFRVLALPGPGTGSRLVVDVAHFW